MLSSLLSRNNSLTIGLTIVLDSISAIISSSTINTFSPLDYNLTNVHKHYQLFVNNQ